MTVPWISPKHFEILESDGSRSVTGAHNCLPKQVAKRRRTMPHVCVCGGGVGVEGGVQQYKVPVNRL